MTFSISPSEFMSAAPAPLNGNTPFAGRYAAELRRVFHEQAERAPRSLQAHLGPSELGVECDRQVAGKMAHLPKTNHVADPWPSIRGTALHAYAAEAFTDDNERHGLRWVAEQRVTPHPLHPGTADLYDAKERAVVDHKFLGVTSMAKIRSDEGPPRHYVVQLLLYGRGYRTLGLPVDRVMIAAYPATAGSLSGLYVWERAHTPADDELLDEVFRRTEVRRKWAIALITGAAQLSDVPAAPDDQLCYFCLSAETEVATRGGTFPIAELAGTKPELLVPRGMASAGRGDFVAAPVRAMGSQRLYAVTLSRGRARKVVHATAEHRWITAEGAVRTTTELADGMRLATVKADVVESNEDRDAVARGFIFGDGARATGNRKVGTLSIYGRSRKHAMLAYYPDFTPKHYPAAGGDTVTHLYGIPREWKQLPELSEGRRWLLSWLAGYFAADGTVSTAGQATISSADRAALERVRDVTVLCGVGHGLIRSKMRVGINQTEASELFSIDLHVRDLPSWFFLLPHHRERAATRRANPDTRDLRWTVRSVELTDRVETVYCATVPEIEAFALSDGLTTGNCPFYRPQTARDGGVGCAGHAPSTPLGH